ncbi:MAG: hypothetical protein AAF722_18170, partial [Cyanobacteria bacterium P01_C01_bin.70]
QLYFNLNVPESIGMLGDRPYEFLITSETAQMPIRLRWCFTLAIKSVSVSSKSSLKNIDKLNFFVAY